LFCVAALAILITPGPAVLYIVARSVDQGRLAGIVSTLGVAAGTLFHIAAATAGVSALLLSSALAFSVLKYLGAAYLIYLGIRKFLIPDEIEASEVRAPKRLTRVFVQGLVVNVLNPKTALFFLAFLPQFVDLSKGSVAWQMLLLGVIFVLLGILSDGAWALLASSAGNWLKRNLRFLQAQRYFAGSVFIVLGVVTALAEPGKK
jgi:threonine/homoserine/homoserine lactone efflux protein